MTFPCRRNTLLAAAIYSLVTFLIMAATRPEPRTLFVAADGSILPGTPLDRIIPEFNVKDVPFRDSILQLSKQLGVPIRIRTATMTAAGEDPNTPVTLHLINARAATILEEALRIEDQGEKLPKLAFWKSDDGIEISTEDEAAEATIINRMYFVNDVVQNIVAQDKEPWEPPENPPPSFISGNAPKTGPMTAVEASEVLIKLTQEMVATDTWKDNGGAFGYIWAPVPSILLVRQTASNQAQIASLFDRLAKMKSFRRVLPDTTDPANPQWQ